MAAVPGPVLSFARSSLPFPRRTLTSPPTCAARPCGYQIIGRHAVFRKPQAEGVIVQRLGQPTGRRARLKSPTPEPPRALALPMYPISADRAYLPMILATGPTARATRILEPQCCHRAADVAERPGERRGAAIRSWRRWLVWRSWLANRLKRLRLTTFFYGQQFSVPSGIFTLVIYHPWNFRRRSLFSILNSLPFSILRAGKNARLAYAQLLLHSQDSRSSLMCLKVGLHLSNKP